MEEVGIRRNIQALPQRERRQFFWCLKMLGILPPFKALSQRTYFSRGISDPDITAQTSSNAPNLMKPNCLHDQLVGNHSACCEHHNLFFAYYHRHLIILAEMRLNYVDECLRLTAEQFNQKFPILFGKDQDLCKEILTKYKELVPIKSKVMMHYWNPTNFNSRDDLVIPIQLADPQLYPHQLDEVDRLHFQVQGSYPFEINTKYRWHADPTYYENNRGTFEDNFYLFKRSQKQYSEVQRKMFEGEYGPRQAEDVEEYTRQWCNLNDETQKEMTRLRNYNRWKNSETMNRLSLLQQKEEQVLVGYGGKKNQKQNDYNMHYIKDREIKQKNQVYRHVTYNQLLPHYCLGYSLFNQDNSDYVSYLEGFSSCGLERSHDLMHSRFHFSMSDSRFSIMNLNFYLFHSWIDVQVQMKLRMSSDLRQAEKMNSKLTKMKRRIQLFDPLLNPQMKDKSFGSYPLMEWCDPVFANFVAGNGDFNNQKQLCKKYNLNQDSLFYAFEVYYMVMRNDKQMRTSRHLKECYDNHYIDKNIETYQQFEGFRTFNASYDYQIFETVCSSDVKRFQNETKMLGSLPNLNIPKYLTQMQEQVNKYSIVLRKAISRTKEKTQNKSINYYEKVFKNRLKLLVKFSTGLANKIYFFTANFNNLLKAAKNNRITISEDLKEQLEKDLIIFTIHIFGREQEAKICLNCGQFKHKYVNMDQQLFMRSAKLWNIIQQLILKEVVFDSRVNQQIQNEFKPQDLIQILTIEKGFKLDYVQGADEVILDLVVLSNESIMVQELNIKLYLDVIKVQSGQVISSVNKEVTELDFEDKKKNSFLAVKLNFAKMVDMNQHLKRNDLQDLVYNRISGNVSIGNLFQNFSFKIENYHSLARYKMTVELENQTFRLVVLDSDFGVKRQILKLVE